MRRGHSEYAANWALNGVDQRRDEMPWVGCVAGGTLCGQRWSIPYFSRTAGPLVCCCVLEWIAQAEYRLSEPVWLRFLSL